MFHDRVSQQLTVIKERWLFEVNFKNLQLSIVFLHKVTAEMTTVQIPENIVKV